MLAAVYLCFIKYNLVLSNAPAISKSIGFNENFSLNYDWIRIDINKQQRDEINLGIEVA